MFSREHHGSRQTKCLSEAVILPALLNTTNSNLDKTTFPILNLQSGKLANTIETLTDSYIPELRTSSFRRYNEITIAIFIWVLKDTHHPIEGHLFKVHIFWDPLGRVQFAEQIEVEY